MAYGVMFHVEKDYDISSRKFKELLKAIDVEKYVWKITESDFYNRSNLQNILERNQITGGKKILDELNCDVMMIWIALEGYKSEKDIEESDGTFKKYLESKCEIAVFVVDTYMFTVYSKNDVVLNNAIEFAKKNTTGKIEITGEEHADCYFGV